MLCLFDCLTEGITILFVFGHVSSRLAMIKCGGMCFQLCSNAAINPLVLFREGFNSHSGYNISYTRPYILAHRVSVYVEACYAEAYCLRLPGTYPSARDRVSRPTCFCAGLFSVRLGWLRVVFPVCLC
jgi:hypothetical protein